MTTATQLRWLLTPDDAPIAGKPPAQGWTPCEVGRRPSSRTGVLSVGRFTPPDGKFDNSAPRRTSPEASICTDMRVARWSPPTPSRHCLAARRPEAARHGVRPRQRLNSHPLAPGRAESVTRADFCLIFCINRLKPFASRTGSRSGVLLRAGRHPRHRPSGLRRRWDMTHFTDLERENRPSASASRCPCAPPT